MPAKKNILVYPVILHPEDQGYSVEIPDIDNGTWTQGDNMKDALLMAQDAIGIMLDDKMEYPEPTDLEDIEIKANDIKTVVYIDMEEYHRNNPKTVRKNVTVPEYLVVLGKKKNINFSAVLTEALKNKLEM
ncbi:type II toxin-antitoxin system HicB family antitoxin [Companilactobacillus formosensis]|jgi:predicted RNase H-like HicB family nuclease|uniref:type II toxin-antitoxin system HicB family antitoxin n=1 Tax=Companilactobacillus formosensis TaxID=1617889 RepID=UPI000E64E48B|nr:type II toxin-antitoxin system HicB family antitoxin [Companilactobacillus formosensis]